MEEGEMEARSRKAKQMKPVDKDKEWKYGTRLMVTRLSRFQSCSSFV
jgi:hypothetical protein